MNWTPTIPHFIGSPEITSFLKGSKINYNSGGTPLNLLTNFLLVDAPSTINKIIGRVVLEGFEGSHLNLSPHHEVPDG